ncbi:hypothetical protein A0H76_417 [Hepatospora eriocheir]|uniref:Uncharacterized protein n=1 Tax=Hepatospora eriocheir TaxID=1081669 RepID=A0A1X0QIU0_9MICR|nr:hypothetical protein A0H76_417 [Hepatospora eriocheir]
MVILKIKEIDLFIKFISIFKKTKFITFEISLTVMKVYSSCSYHIHLLISEDMYNITQECSFTISTKYLFDSLKRVDVSFIILDSSFHIISDPNTEQIRYASEIELFYQNKLNTDDEVIEFTNEIKDTLFKNYIDIPFLTLTTFNLSATDNILSMFLISKEYLKLMPDDLTKYNLLEELVLEPSITSFDEKYEIPVDYLKNEYCAFQCNNNWIITVQEIYLFINSVTFETYDNFLLVKILLNKKYTLIFEVPKK